MSTTTQFVVFYMSNKCQLECQKSQMFVLASLFVISALLLSSCVQEHDCLLLAGSADEPCLVFIRVNMCGGLRKNYRCVDSCHLLMYC